jgi:hypothetical protein
VFAQSSERRDAGDCVNERLRLHAQQCLSDRADGRRGKAHKGKAAVSVADTSMNGLTSLHLPPWSIPPILTLMSCRHGRERGGFLLTRASCSVVQIREGPAATADNTLDELDLLLDDVAEDDEEEARQRYREKRIAELKAEAALPQFGEVINITATE